MNNFFEYDEKSGKVILSDPQILLVDEFLKLLTIQRNKCNEDPSGLHKLRAFRELTYIYLAIDWKSLYSGYTNQERHEAALRDAQITEDEWNDPIFRAACRKYVEILDSNRYVRLLQAAQEVTDKIIDYFGNIDLTAIDSQGKPVYKISDILKAMENASKLIESLKYIESLVKKEMAEQSQIRGGAVEGFTPDV